MLPVPRAASRRATQQPRPYRRESHRRARRAGSGLPPGRAAAPLPRPTTVSGLPGEATAWPARRRERRPGWRGCSGKTSPRPRALRDRLDPSQRSAGPLLVHDQFQCLADRIGGNGTDTDHDGSCSAGRVLAADRGPAQPGQQQPENDQGALAGHLKKRAHPCRYVRNRSGHRPVRRYRSPFVTSVVSASPSPPGDSHTVAPAPAPSNATEPSRRVTRKFF